MKARRGEGRDAGTGFQAAALHLHLSPGSTRLVKPSVLNSSHRSPGWAPTPEEKLLPSPGCGDVTFVKAGLGTISSTDWGSSEGILQKMSPRREPSEAPPGPFTSPFLPPSHRSDATSLLVLLLECSQSILAFLRRHWTRRRYSLAPLLNAQPKRENMAPNPLPSLILEPPAGTT